MTHRTQDLLAQAASQRIAGEWDSAIVLCREAFDRSAIELDIGSLSEAVLTMGHCYREIGEIDLAVDHLALAVVLARLNDEPNLAARALNGEGILNMQMGATEEAERLYREARELAVLVNDPLTIGTVDQNLGILANIRGDSTDALNHYADSLANYKLADARRNIAGVLNNQGMLQIDLGQLVEAKQSLDDALAIARNVKDVVTESIVQTNRAELFIALGDLTNARASCDEAFEVASRLGNNRTKTEALKFYGIIYREIGKPHLAEIHLRQAIAIASKHGNPLAEAESRREMALVLRAQERNREALEAFNQAHALFTSLQAKQDQADINKRLTQLEEDFLALVRMWGESIEAKDRYTSGHCQRVADYACLIAERAGLSERDMVWFRMGAFLHDVGKTDIPGEILNKPGRLTDEERATIERHTVIGDEMLAPIPFPWDIRPMVRGHHERWDGRGYPDGLTGQEIHLTARILRIADIFDALTTTRSYREPLSAEQARQIMREDNGSFDPDVFAIFEDLYPQFEVMVAGVHAARMPRADHPANTPSA